MAAGLTAPFHASRPGAAGSADVVPLYPSLREAAKLIGVSASTLSRRADVVRVRAGQETRVPAAEVLRLAAAYRRRPVSQVAATLVARAQTAEPAVRRAFEDEVDRALDQHQAAPSLEAADVAALLAAVDRLFPPERAAQLRSLMTRPLTDDRAESGVIGWDPGTD